MAYSNTWDETAPLDTSLANLIGQDIRTFKLDIRQRLAQISGPLSSRPTPDPPFVGITYLATDTYQMFQWNGTAWVDVTQALRGSTILFRDPPSSFVGTGASQTLVSHTLPGNYLSDHGGVRISARAWNDDGSNQSTSRTMVLNVYFGSAAFGLSTGAQTASREVGVDVEIFNNYNVAQQWHIESLLGSSSDIGWEGSNYGPTNAFSTVDTSQNVQITCIAIVDNGTKCMFGGFYVRLLAL